MEVRPAADGGGASGGGGGSAAAAGGGGGKVRRRTFSTRRDGSSPTNLRGIWIDFVRSETGGIALSVEPGSGDAYMKSTHELYLKKLPSYVPQTVQNWYKYIAIALAVCEWLMAAACLIEASKCKDHSRQAHPRVLGLVVPCCAFYAVSTTIDKCFAAVRIRAKYRDEQEWTVLLHQIFTLGLQLVMLATSSFIIANASDALTLTSQFVAVQLIAQIDVVFARVLQIRDPAPDFFQSRLSGASRVVERSLFVVMIVTMCGFTYAIRRGRVACTLMPETTGMATCCNVGHCFQPRGYNVHYAPAVLGALNCSASSTYY